MSTISMSTRLLSEAVNANRVRNNTLVEAVLRGAENAAGMRRNGTGDGSDLQARYRHALASAAAALIRPSGVPNWPTAINYQGGERRDRPQEVALIASSITGDIPWMKDLLDSGADANYDDEFFGAPLSVAAFGGHMSAVKLLLDHDADCTWSSLVYGAITGHVSVCNLLINAGAPVDRSLWYAAAAGQDTVVTLLLDQRDIDLNDKYFSPLLVAIERDHPKVVGELLKDPRVNLEINDWDQTLLALEMAASLGRESIVKLLLSHPDADPDSGGNGYVLTSAVEAGHAGVVRLLLDSPHVNPNARPNDQGRPLSGGLTPLIRAATLGHDDVVKALISHKDIDVNLKSTEAPEWDGWTPLGKAVTYGNYDVVATLLEHPQIQPDIPQALGKTALMQAARDDQTEIADLLLACDRVDPNVEDCNGCAIVMHAAAWGSPEVMKSLLNYPGIQVHVRGDDGETPLTRSAMAGLDLDFPEATEGAYKDIVELLLDHREGEEPTEDHIRKALEVAQEYGAESIQQVLQHTLDSNRYS